MRTIGPFIKDSCFYPSSPINIDHSVLNSYKCKTFYIPGLEDTQQIQKYFPAKDSDIDWNALFLHNGTVNQILPKEFNASFDKLKNNMMDHKNNLLLKVYRCHIAGFQ